MERIKKLRKPCLVKANSIPYSDNFHSLLGTLGVEHFLLFQPFYQRGIKFRLAPFFCAVAVLVIHLMEAIHTPFVEEPHSRYQSCNSSSSVGSSGEAEKVDLVALLVIVGQETVGGTNVG